MRIDLDNVYSIKSDENNFILVENRVKGKDSVNVGEAYEVSIGYYGSLSVALSGYIKNYLRKNEDISNIEELIEAVNELHTTISKLAN
mgnify:FL=1